MNPGDARDRVALRLFEWSLGDWQREIKQGFPLIRSLKSEEIYKFMAFTETLSKDKVEKLSVALVKRFHVDAMRLRRDSLTIEEQAMIDGFLHHQRYSVSVEHDRLLAEEIAGRHVRKLDRKQFSRRIHDALQPILGNSRESVGSGAWRYLTPVGEVQVRTEIDIGGSLRQLTYFQDILHVGESIHSPTNLLSWLGISSQTDWDCLTEADTGPAARGLAQLCAHFLSAAPNLVVGLSPD